jgi:hypothetical protein
MAGDPCTSRSTFALRLCVRVCVCVSMYACVFVYVCALSAS